MNLPDTRQMDVSYNIRKSGEHYEVKQYLQTQPLEVAHGFYSWSALPEWVRTCMALLDTAGVGVIVKGYGIRTPESYWINDWDTDAAQQADPNTQADAMGIDNCGEDA